MNQPSTAGVLMTVQTVVICAQPALLCNIMLHPGSAASSITVYDNASAASGKVIAVLQGVANGSTISFPFDSAPVGAVNGLTAVVAGTAAQGQVYFQRMD